MDKIENQQVPDYRNELVSRMKSRYPDRNFDGSNGTDSPNNLEQSIIEALDSQDSQISDMTSKNKEYEEYSEKLNTLFAGSPRSAVFLNELAKTKNPAVAIYKAFGKEAYDSFVDGDASELIAKIESEDAKTRAEDEKWEQEKSENLKKSFADLDAWGDEKGLNEDQKEETFMRFYNILADALVGKYGRDLFEMGWKADHYSDDVATARHDGEVTGRNAKIEAGTRKRKESASMPPSLSGQGVRATEAAPVKREDDPWMLRS